MTCQIRLVDPMVRTRWCEPDDLIFEDRDPPDHRHVIPAHRQMGSQQAIEFILTAGEARELGLEPVGQLSLALAQLQDLGAQPLEPFGTPEAEESKYAATESNEPILHWGISAISCLWEG
jgi:hypothetical protein